MKWFSRKYKPKKAPSYIRTLEDKVFDGLECCMLPLRDEIMDRMSNREIEYTMDLIELCMDQVTNDKLKLEVELEELKIKEQDYIAEQKRKKPLAGVQ